MLNDRVGRVTAKSCYSAGLGLHIRDGATVPAKGVRTLTVHRLGFRMVSEYVSYNPPTNVGMKMLTGSWFFERLGGGWRFSPVPESPESTRAVWRYNFACKPKWLAPLAERIGAIILQRDIDKRIAGFSRGCADPVVVEAARAQISGASDGPGSRTR